jgi:hypothetical protein
MPSFVRPLVPLIELPLDIADLVTAQIPGIYATMNKLALGLSALLATGSLSGSRMGLPALQAASAQSSYLLGLGIGDITGCACEVYSLNA